MVKDYWSENALKQVGENNQNYLIALWGVSHVEISPHLIRCLSQIH